MSALATNFADATVKLHAQFRELSLVEEDLKRDVAFAQQQLEGVRELKKNLKGQIFRQHQVSPTTTTNGHNHPRPV
jgi:hypothetical protein